MAIMAKGSDSARELVPPGTYVAVCNAIYDLGIQAGGQYGAKHQVLMQFQLTKRNKAGVRYQISNYYTLSFGSKANLRQDIESWLGRSFDDDEVKRGFDVTELLGKPCQLAIVNKKNASGATRDYISSVMGLPEEVPAPKIEGNEVLYELDSNAAIPSEVPEWVAKMIERSKERVEARGETFDEGGSSEYSAPATNGQKIGDRVAGAISSAVECPPRAVKPMELLGIEWPFSAQQLEDAYASEPANRERARAMDVLEPLAIEF